MIKNQHLLMFFKKFIVHSFKIIVVPNSVKIY